MLRNLLLANPAADEKLFVEDVFSTWLYTGNSSTQTITNGIDLAGKGGLVWIKSRVSSVRSHQLYDTVRGATQTLSSNTTSAQSVISTSLTGFTSSGFSLSTDVGVNEAGSHYASWTFREAPKFFDVVNWTGNGVNGRTIPHALGVTPGFVVVKRTDGTGDWVCWHRSLGTDGIILNSTSASAAYTAVVNYLSQTTSTNVVVGTNDLNQSGATYVAYLFAHDTTSDGIIQCGSFTTDSTGAASVTLGWEPQWSLVKWSAGAGDNWLISDNMRGMPVSGASLLLANTTGNEGIGGGASATATGFQFAGGQASSTYIYIAIRRGPMRTPTSGTSVFQPVAYTATNVDNRLVTTGIVTDMVMARTRDTSAGAFYVADRLRANASLGTVLTAVENTDADSYMTPTVGYGNAFSAMDGFGVGNDITRKLNYLTSTQIAHAFRRAPSFFDVVCYTGTGAATTFNHNLGAVPELMIVKQRNITARSWCVYSAATGAANALFLESTSASTSTTYWNSTAPTSTVFTLGNVSTVNTSGSNYVAYLFASCPGVSKVGSYTGNGSSQTINCGFAAGARFVMIKRTDSTGNWHVWDTARGIIAANDPILYLNGNDAELTTNDSVDPDNSGFIVNQNATTNINVSGATYIYLAIA